MINMYSVSENRCRGLEPPSTVFEIPSRQTLSSLFLSPHAALPVSWSFARKEGNSLLSKASNDQRTSRQDVFSRQPIIPMRLDVFPFVPYPTGLVEGEAQLKIDFLHISNAAGTILPR